jgi:hypothetical protein
MGWSGKAFFFSCLTSTSTCIHSWTPSLQSPQSSSVYLTLNLGARDGLGEPQMAQSCALSSQGGRDMTLLSPRDASPHMPFKIILPREYNVRSGAMWIRAGKSRLVLFLTPMHTLLVSLEIFLQVESRAALLTCKSSDVFAMYMASRHV